MDLDLSALMAQVGTARANIQARSGNNNAVKPPAGKSRWRILPGWRPAEPGKFYHEFAQHWIKEPDPAGGKPLNKGTVVCDAVTFGKACEHCETLSSIKGAMKAAGLTNEHPIWKQIDELRAGRVYLVNALRRDGAEKSDQPIMLSLPESALTGYLSIFATRGEEGLNLLALTGGKDIIIEKTGAGFDTKYSVTDAGNTSDVPAEVMGKLVNIDAYIESERQKGAPKAHLLAPAAKKILALTSSLPQSTLLIPAAASLIPTPVARPTPSRTIEPDETPFVTSTPVASAPVVTPAVTPAPATDGLLADDELAEMLKLL